MSTKHEVKKTVRKEAIEEVEVMDIDDLEEAVGGASLRYGAISRSPLRSSKNLRDIGNVGSYRTVMCPW